MNRTFHIDGWELSAHDVLIDRIGEKEPEPTVGVQVEKSPLGAVFRLSVPWEKLKAAMITAHRGRSNSNQLSRNNDETICNHHG